jgi:hypothetical protein
MKSHARSFESQVLSALKRIEKKLGAIQIEEEQMDADVRAAIDQAKKNTDAETAAVALLDALFAKLTAALAGTGPISAADRAELQATVASMASSSDKMGAAIVKDTPAA